MPAWTGGTILRLGVVRLNSIDIRKRILEGSKVGSGRGLFWGVFEPDFDETEMSLRWVFGTLKLTLYTEAGILVFDMGG